MKSVNGVQLADYAYDACISDTVIALHGIGGSSNSFIEQASIGHDQLNFLAWDMPGYQHTDLLRPTTFKTLSDHLLQAIDGLELDKAHLLGHSIGGMIALELAARHPDRVASLCLIGTTAAFGGKDDGFKQTFLKARVAPLDAGKTMADLANAFVPELLGENPDPIALTNAVESMQAIPDNTYRAIIECLITFNRRDALTDLTMPCCLIAGGRDNNAPAQTMEKMAAKIPDADYYLLEPAGHLLNLEQPQRMNTIISSFYRKQKSI